jgi:hypothetical protein
LAGWCFLQQVVVEIYAEGGFGSREGGGVSIQDAPAQVISNAEAEHIRTQLAQLTDQLTAEHNKTESRLAALERLLRQALGAAPAAGPPLESANGKANAKAKAKVPSPPAARYTTLRGVTDVFNGCAAPVKLPDRAASKACAAIGMRRVGTRLASGTPLVEVHDPLWYTRDTAVKKRAAICMVGQMRSFPVAFAQWRDYLFPLLRTGGAEIDLYAITSNSSSLVESARILNSLPLAGKSVVSKIAFLHRPDEDWAWRDRPTNAASLLSGTALAVLEFNTAKFPEGPGDEAEKRDSYFIQLWQVAKCKEMILEQEVKFKFKYERVARMRTDVTFVPSEGHGHPTPVTSFPSSCLTTDSAEQCVAGMEKLHHDQFIRCQKSISNLDSKKSSWQLPITHDRAVVGTRDIVLNSAFSGLEQLSTTLRKTFKGSWNLKHFVKFHEPVPGHCTYHTPIMRMSRQLGYQGPGSSRPAVAIGTTVTLSQLQANRACAPDRTLNPHNTSYHLAIDRMASVPKLRSMVECMEIGSCRVDGENGLHRSQNGLLHTPEYCGVKYGEHHFNIKAGADTEVGMDAQPDFKGG